MPCGARYLGAALALGAVLRASSAWADDADQTERDTNQLDAAEAETNRKQHARSKWNALDGPVFTMRIGGGFLTDVATYGQSEASKQQLDLEPKLVLRDARILLHGEIKVVKGLSYSVGYM